MARTGRPRKDPQGSLRINGAFRMTEAMRDRLAASADVSGRSISEEIEARLERSFLADDFRLIVREELQREHEQRYSGPEPRTVMGSLKEAPRWRV